MRFEDNGNGTLIDRHTGLIWMADGGTPDLPGLKGGRKPWCGPFPEPPVDLPPQRTGCYGPVEGIVLDGLPVGYPVFDYIDRLNEVQFAGHSDWRLPNINELASLIEDTKPHGHLWLMDNGFRNLPTHCNYWSSTTCVSHPDQAWHVHFTTSANVHTSNKIWCSHFILPVCGINCGPRRVLGTGQTQCYGPEVRPSLIPFSGRGQDGDLRRGERIAGRFEFVAGPDGDPGVVIDRYMHLAWRAAPLAPKLPWDAANALSELEWSEWGRWRLPRREEFLSLAQYNHGDGVGALHAEGFSGIAHCDYWTSQECANSREWVWSFGFGKGLYMQKRDVYEATAWPVCNLKWGLTAF